MKLIAFFSILLLIIYLSSLNWHRSVKLVFFLVVFEGAIRKWILPQASDLIYFLKDFILLGAYLQYFFLSKQKIKFPITNNWINILIFSSVGFGLFQAFNPSLGSIFIGILGLKAYFFYIPLIWMLPSMFQSEEDLIEFLRWHLLLAIPVGILGMVQYISPADSWINQYASGEVSEIAVTGGGAIRITSTFSYINSYQGYLIAVFGLLLPFLFADQPRKWKIATIIEICLVAGNSLMTGSRTPVYAEAFIAGGYLFWLGIAQPSKILRWLDNLLIPMIAAAAAAFLGFRSAIDSFSERATTSKDLSDRISSIFRAPLVYAKIKDLDGYGIGATHSGAGALRSRLGLPIGEQIEVYHEAELGRVVLELGPLGFILWYALRISIAITLFLRFLQLKRPFLRNLALAACLTHLIQLPGQVVFHHTFSLYYWLLSSFIFVLPEVEALENWRTKQQLLTEENVRSSYLTSTPDR